MTKLKVFYDGSCHLCDKEIKYYLKIDKRNLLEGIDITNPKFDPSHYGLNKEQVNTHLHAIDEEGKVFSKIDSFVEIWKRVYKNQVLIKVISNKFIRFLADKSYIVFAEYIRPKLPKKKTCYNSECSL
ncbi:MAG: DUF393 domain-containing protein [Bacteriovoracaceae bacterium]|jgi:predicted DCC family thiol-disulfide oxidoreductase YuxK|nr:DUF393 domain-containing protein [Bacteriovoracaceae bacterium]